MPDLPPGIPVPPHAYVPGQNARHPEDWFDEIKSSVASGMTPTQLSDTQAFKAGLAYLDAGYFWECHEVLEAVWMQAVPNSQARHMVQAVIQLANAQLKLVMKRPNAARRLCDMVEGHLHDITQDAPIPGLKVQDLRGRIAQVRLQIVAL